MLGQTIAEKAAARVAQLNVTGLQKSEEEKDRIKECNIYRAECKKWREANNKDA